MEHSIHFKRLHTHVRVKYVVHLSAMQYATLTHNIRQAGEPPVAAAFSTSCPLCTIHTPWSDGHLMSTPVHTHVGERDLKRDRDMTDKHSFT